MTITAKTTVFSDPTPGIRRRPMPPLSQVQNDAYLQQATGGLGASTTAPLALYRRSRAGQQALAMNLFYAMFTS